MGIAYSQATILKTTLRADTSAHFRADLDTALLSCGWSVAHTVTNGKVYEMTAPVSLLTARLLVQDQGTGSSAGSWIVLQMKNSAETLAGIAHTIIVGGVVAFYQAIVGKCQLFISVPGRTTNVYNFDQSSSFACGIPSLPPDTPSSLCVVGIGDPPAVTDVWWSNGPGNGLNYNPDFRLGPTCYTSYCFEFNGVVTTGVTGVGANDPSQGMLTLGYLTPTFNVDAALAPNQQVITYGAGTPLRIDALLLWLWAIRGQLWDAFQMTAAQPLDALMSFFDNNQDGSTFQINCQVWNAGYYSSLLLLTESPFSSAAFGYVY